MTSGNLPHVTIPKYPDVSIQGAVAPSPWWIEDTSKDFRRGRLIWAILPHVDQDPLRVIPIGRAQADVHEEITIRIEPLRSHQPRPNILFPVAAMPEFPGEVRIIQRAKRRPALILGLGGTKLPPEMTLNRPKSQVSTVMSVAPYYGGTQDGTRAGFPPEFLDRVRRCEFPQFIWECLPLGNRKTESLLYLNHIQPLGLSRDSIELTNFRLSDDAMTILDEWTIWVITGQLPKDGVILPVRTELLEMV